MADPPAARVAVGGREGDREGSLSDDLIPSYFVQVLYGGLYERLYNKVVSSAPLETAKVIVKATTKNGNQSPQTSQTYGAFGVSGTFL